MESKISKIRSSCSIAWAWRILGIPGEPGRNIKSPFREDKKPSFSLYNAKDGERWYDQATGEGGDVCDFWAKAKEISVQEAIVQLGRMIGEAEPPPKTAYRPAEEKKTVEWPSDLRPPTIEEYESLGMLRELPAGAFDLASRLGFLKVGMHKGEVLWFLTDASRKGAEGKTFTGEPCLASGKKTAALPGTSKSWCYGLQSDNEFWDKIDKLVLVEGVPDFFAALELLTDWPGNARPIAMLGASTKPGNETAQYFRGKTVLIIPHNDPEGEKAVKIWVDRLTGWNATVEVQRLPSGKDLNEFIVSPGDINPLDLLKGF
jgi:hypothetical protein